MINSDLSPENESVLSGGNGICSFVPDTSNDDHLFRNDNHRSSVLDIEMGDGELSVRASNDGHLFRNDHHRSLVECDIASVRRLHRRLSQRQSRACESPAQRAARLQSLRDNYAQRRSAESDAQRQSRLALRREQRAGVVRENRRRNPAINLSGLAFAYYPDINYSVHPLLSIGQLDKVCRYCQAKCFKGEPNGICCAKGKLRLPFLSQPPEPYLTLFSGDYPESRHFLKHIRRYNSCFQMTSFGVQGSIFNDGFMPTFRIQGQIYHRIGSILPLADAQPKYLQIYFMGDANAQVDLRCNIYRDLHRNIVANF